jgi:hypothetical protein
VVELTTIVCHEESAGSWRETSAALRSVVGRRFLSWVHIRLIGNAAAVAAGGDEAKAAETERNR